MLNYSTRLRFAIEQKETAALVGLDPRWDFLPQPVREAAEQRGGDQYQIRASAYEAFCLQVIDIVADLVPAVKPQSAFFEECGPAGVTALANVMTAARDAGLITICDAKRGDIGNTAEAYAAAYLAGADPGSAPFGADALTINPYLGIDTLQPFLTRAKSVGGGLYVLVRTSNPGARDFQDRQTDGSTLYQAVAQRIEELSHSTATEDGYGCVGAVVGATYPQELAELRKAMPHVPLLVPGYGSQGGTSQDVAAAFDETGHGALVNSSRGILFGYRSGQLAEQYGEARWEDAIEAATKLMIADLAANTPCGKLQS
ncbi:orotidine-5'-phosphate decarboxylase [Planctomicrobium sp. SH664]|uniref:orotidine-5'-phosphate decarboxylase n=1 Tax=Planctomicrobium sp. SH664 TaxID=3448125 RepID=UPI003F5C257D